MNEIAAGVYLAKHVIVVCAGDASGRALFFKDFGSWFCSRAVNLPACGLQLRALLGPHALHSRPRPELFAPDLMKPFFGRAKQAPQHEERGRHSPRIRIYRRCWIWHRWPRGGYERALS